MASPFRLVSEFEPKGDQPEAIRRLVEGLRSGQKHQVLLGVTGSGKTFTMAKAIEAVGRTSLVLSHNKTLAAQLFQEFRRFFPDNAVEYFVSYYDYYQPEAYIPQSDTYIEKESTINDEIDRLRHSATRSLFERRDVIIVASVSCIYGLGSPEAYHGMMLLLEPGKAIDRDAMLRKLVEIQYERTPFDIERGKFRVRGDVIEIFPSYEEFAVRVELFGDDIESVSAIDPIRGAVMRKLDRIPIYPNSHYVTPRDRLLKAIESIKAELKDRLAVLESEKKLLEAQRLHQRTMFDLEMIKEIGYCQGIENYSRHLTGRQPGEPPPTLLDYLPDDHVMLIDESHVSIPQVRGMYHGDRARKLNLVEYGFRLPSAVDNRPLQFEEFEARVGQRIGRDQVLRKLVEIQYERNDADFSRGTFRVRGDIIEVYPSYEESALRIGLFGDEVDELTSFDPITGKAFRRHERTAVYPKSHFVTGRERLKEAVVTIKEELEVRRGDLEREGKVLEAQRLHQRTMFDLEMIKEIGYCHGIENYSRHLTQRKAGQPPPTLLDYLPSDALIVVDESHQSVPQVRGMYHGDRSRKEVLVEYGFRLPSALDNRPLNFEEWEARVGQLVYVSATPGPYELNKSGGVVVEQVIRPTGLMDPPIEVRPVKGQVDDLLKEIRDRAERKERVLVTTLTKRMAEDLTTYYQELGVKVRYLHSDIDTLERVEILRDLRRGVFDVLVGINLLREGLDLPEVSLVAILDADKEGFLRSGGALIQTSGRAARNINGRVIMYADKETDSMRVAISETARRRKRQAEYNEEHGITPTSIVKSIEDVLSSVYDRDYSTIADPRAPGMSFRTHAELEAHIATLDQQMKAAAANLDFEKAASLRDQIRGLRTRDLGLGPAPRSDSGPAESR